MIGSISATAVYVESLPAPPQLMVGRPISSVNGGGDDKMILALAKRVEQIAAVNRQRLQVMSYPTVFSFCLSVLLFSRQVFGIANQGVPVRGKLQSL